MKGKEQRRRNDAVHGVLQRGRRSCGQAQRNALRGGILRRGCAIADARLFICHCFLVYSTLDNHLSRIRIMSTAATAPPASAATPVAAADAAAPAASADPSCISVRVEFSGGLELLFDRIKSRTLTLSPSALGLASSDELTMRALIEHLKQRYCTERHELFVAEDSVSVESEANTRATMAHELFACDCVC
jgi:hypothetical protein